MPSSTPAHWSPNQYRPVQEYTYKFTPNGELRIHVFFPFDWKPIDSRPGIVFFFGGGWNSGSPVQFFRHAMYLTGRGMVAACADYRVKSRHETTPLDAVEDAKAAVRWLRAHAAGLGLDAQRIAAGGGSSGGHLAACTAMVPGLDAEGDDLSVSPAANLLVLFNPALDLRAAGPERFGLSADDARLISPIEHLSAQAPATIMCHGSQDRMCATAREYKEKADAVGAHVELDFYEGLGHGFFNRDPWFAQTLRRADEFLTAHGYLTGPPTVDPT
ncbi:MAG TPA: alpha/beta hydrolase [Phycisphaerae bacterium]|nr:alpha/beta hydrolase [Phycisphaerae bacterium]